MIWGEVCALALGAQARARFFPRRGGGGGSRDGQRTITLEWPALTQGRPSKVAATILAADSAVLVRERFGLRCRNTGLEAPTHRRPPLSQQRARARRAGDGFVGLPPCLTDR